MDPGGGGDKVEALGDGQWLRALVSQAWGPEFRPQTHIKRQAWPYSPESIEDVGDSLMSQPCQNSELLFWVQ